LPPVLIADKLVSQGHYSEAEAAYSELLQSDPGAPEILLKRGSIRVHLGRYKDARADLEAVLAIPQPRSSLAIAHAQLGLLEEVLGRYAQAIQHHRIALQLKQACYGARDPSVGITLNRLGQSFLASGSISNAQDALAAAVDILAASPGYELHLCLAHTNAGRVFLEQRRFVEAADSFEHARQINKEENVCAALIAKGLGQLHYTQRNLPEAEASFRESIRIGQRLWPGGHAATAAALQGLARTAAARKHFAEARELFQKSIEMDERVLGPAHPDVREVLLDLAALLLAAHRGQEARLIIERIQRDFPASLNTISLNALARAKM